MAVPKLEILSIKRKCLTPEKDNEFGVKRRLKYLRESNEFGMTSEDDYNF